MSIIFYKVDGNYFEVHENFHFVLGWSDPYLYWASALLAYRDDLGVNNSQNGTNTHSYTNCTIYQAGAGWDMSRRNTSDWGGIHCKAKKIAGIDMENSLCLRLRTETRPLRVGWLMMINFVLSVFIHTKLRAEGGINFPITEKSCHQRARRTTRRDGEREEAKSLVKFASRKLVTVDSDAGTEIQLKQ